MAERPNILLVLNDDMGFSDLGCYGGEAQTPALDQLAAGGLRYTQFYNTARCCPSRASLLTGLHPHQVGVGHMMDDRDEDGYRGDLSRNCVTIAEALRPAGYRTYMAGKWHVTRFLDGPKHNWPLQRGFDRFYGTITGAGSYFNPTTLTDGNEPIEPEGDDYFYTDAISDHAVEFLRDHETEHSDKPFFAYVAYTAPHWPLHAPPEDADRCKGRFDAGWDKLREERLERMVATGLIDSRWQLSPRDPTQPPWDEAGNHAWQTRRMEVYMSQIERMDQGIGRIVDELRRSGSLDNTLILFLADNGGCAEEIQPGWAKSLPKSRIAREFARDGRPVQVGNVADIMPGAEDTYQSYGVAWANLSNTPFRRYKHWVHEGGISTPLIAHWSVGIADRGALRHQLGQLPDIMATCLELASAACPATREGQAVPPPEGTSLLPTFSSATDDAERTLYWEHEGNRAVRRGRWKLVCAYPGPWELYDMAEDRSELRDLSAAHPEIARELASLHDAWASRCGVVPWDEMAR